MASPLVYKVYDKDRNYIGATRYCEDAAAIVAGHGNGTVIKVGGRIFWKEGKEQWPASASYDFVAKTVWQREREAYQAYIEERERVMAEHRRGKA